MELNKDKLFFKSYKELFLPPYKLDAIEVAVYGLLAERYQFFTNLNIPQKSLVKNKKGQVGILYSGINLANDINTTRKKISKTIAKLEAIGLIEVERRGNNPSIYIVNPIHKIVESNDPTRCVKRLNALGKKTQRVESNGYNNKNKKKDLIKNPERGTASPEGSACPPAVNNNTNDGIQGEVATISGKGLSLPSEKDNEVLIDMMSPSEQDTIVVTPNGNTDQQDNDGIKQREQSPSSGPSQPGINNNSTTAASSQNLPEGYMLLKDWLPKNCRVQYVIDTVLAQLDGNIICPPDKGHSKEWAAIMPQIARALPHVRDLLIHLGYAQKEIDSVISYVRRRNGTATRVIGYFAPQSLYTKSEDSPLGVYVKADQWISL